MPSRIGLRTPLTMSLEYRVFGSKPLGGHSVVSQKYWIRNGSFKYSVVQMS